MYWPMSKMVSRLAEFSAALVAIIAVVFIWQTVSLRSTVRRLEQENRTLANQLQKLKSQPAPAPRVVTAPAPVSPPERPEPSPADLRALAQKNEAISKLQDDLAAARAQIGDLQNSVLTLKGQNSSLDQQAREKLAAAAANCNQRLADAAHSLDAIQGDLTTEKSKAAELVEANRALRAQAAAPKPVRPTSDLAAQLRDITLRRESYLRGVLRRSRHISAQYRSFSGAMAGRQDQQITPWNSAEVSRIESAISSAEDDLRQLDALNAQASLLEKKLAKQ